MPAVEIFWLVQFLDLWNSFSLFLSLSPLLSKSSEKHRKFCSIDLINVDVGWSMKTKTSRSTVSEWWKTWTETVHWSVMDRTTLAKNALQNVEQQEIVGVALDSLSLSLVSSWKNFVIHQSTRARHMWLDVLYWPNDRFVIEFRQWDFPCGLFLIWEKCRRVTVGGVHLECRLIAIVCPRNKHIFPVSQRIKNIT